MALKCRHCKRAIVWRELAQKWFHVGNKLTFCDGTSKSPTVAEPRGKK